MIKKGIGIMTKWMAMRCMVCTIPICWSKDFRSDPCTRNYSANVILRTSHSWTLYCNVKIESSIPNACNTSKAKPKSYQQLKINRIYLMCTKTMGKVECVVCFCVTVVCVCVWLLNEHKRHIKCMTKEEFTMMVAADRDNRKK